MGSPPFFIINSDFLEGLMKLRHDEGGKSERANSNAWLRDTGSFFFFFFLFVLLRKGRGILLNLSLNNRWIGIFCNC